MMLLRFVGVNSSGGDNTAFIDNVRVTVIDNVEWLVSDQLGTPRMIFDKTGSLAGTKRHDYLPFGEEVGAYVGQRTTTLGYSNPDGLRQKFTEKERDLETGLDYFTSRYFGSSQGRFTSADSIAGSPSNPQSFNLYAYVQNNPLKLVDPSGHSAVDGILLTNDPNTNHRMEDLLGIESSSGGSEEVGASLKNAPQNPAPTPTPARTPFENKLNDCTQRLFGVEFRSFSASRRGQNGSFTGYGADALSSRGSDSEISVVNEVNAYSQADIKRITGQDWIGVAFGPGNQARGYTPYRNFTANDLTNSRAILATQIHELGNSLQFITGVTMAPNSPAGLGGDTDAGTRLERCVFKGEYDAKGKLHKF